MINATLCKQQPRSHLQLKIFMAKQQLRSHLQLKISMAQTKLNPALLEIDDLVELKTLYSCKWYPLQAFVLID